MIISRLRDIWRDISYPFLQHVNGTNLHFHDIVDVKIDEVHRVRAGDVVALIGDFDSESIATLLHLLERGAIVAPLTSDTHGQHDYFIKESCSQYVFRKNVLVKCISPEQSPHNLLADLRKTGHPGLILFTTGTTGRPKAILHDFIPFIERYNTPRPPLKAIAFLLFDHIGGLNTIFHMLFNQGQVVSLDNRSVEAVVEAINTFSVELLPATPTFLRMMSLYPDIEVKISDSLQIVSYGTERMDQPTLDRLCKQFPNVDFRQTYGMSELGILRVKSVRRDSLYMKVGGEGIETKIIDNVLYIRAKNRMLGYLNAETPFDIDGWYCTKDIVSMSDDGSIVITGRDSEVVNIGGLKFMPSEVELECMKLDCIKFAKASAKPNPITGQHLEVTIEVDDMLADDLESLKNQITHKLKQSLPKHMMPSRITFDKIQTSHRFKKL